MLTSNIDQTLSIELEHFGSNAFDQTWTLLIERFRLNAFDQTLLIKRFWSIAFDQTLLINCIWLNAFDRSNAFDWMLLIEHFRLNALIECIQSNAFDSYWMSTQLAISSTVDLLRYLSYHGLSYEKIKVASNLKIKLLIISFFYIIHLLLLWNEFEATENVQKSVSTVSWRPRYSN